MTSTSVMVLALAAERPSGPYEMIKVLERVNLRRWNPVSDSSIYLTVKKLETHGFLTGTPVREGNMPEKTVYSPTSEGLARLEESLLNYLGSPCESPCLDIAILFLCHLPKERVLKAVESRLDTLGKEIERAERQARSFQDDPSLPFAARLMVRHNLLVKRATAETLKELATETAASKTWNFFPARELG